MWGSHLMAPDAQSNWVLEIQRIECGTSTQKVHTLVNSDIFGN